MPANPKLERNDMTHTTETRPPRAMTRQQGFSLVELAISLTLIAVLLLGAFYIVRNIRTKAQQAMTMAEVTAELIKTTTFHIYSKAGAKK
jgi:prepilin-type N-terminal cleavage/methylation domain-containing protein